MDKQTLAGIRISTEWAVGVGSMLALIAGMGVLTKTAIVLLVVAGIAGLSFAAFEHGWIQKPARRAILVLAVIWFGMGFLGFKTWPPKERVKITPDISWFPAPIKAGDPLTNSQLNAVLTVEGIPIDGKPDYTPAPGATLQSGNQTLHVKFIPSDEVRFAPAEKSVAVVVTSSTATEYPILPTIRFRGVNFMRMDNGQLILPMSIRTTGSGTIHVLTNAWSIAQSPAPSTPELEIEAEDRFWSKFQELLKQRKSATLETSFMPDVEGEVPITLGPEISGGIPLMKKLGGRIYVAVQFREGLHNKVMEQSCFSVDVITNYSRLCSKHNIP
ncbi:hypothetical protein [Tunturiibacter gelidoferens]|uniref:Uncharacterized protein n=1 Tax=Tunturiibacter gelidiferens TaxID=3069689 RepID=A0ACC5NWG2_9BACT|nr:hypothetical protein [Edaphobacter lichenicola]MBB5338688.1 hypothetical protein [Edaphobacter lichenicola]